MNGWSVSNPVDRYLVIGRQHKMESNIFCFFRYKPRDHTRENTVWSSRKIRRDCASFIPKLVRNHLQSLVADPSPCKRPIQPDRPWLERGEAVPAVVGYSVYDLFVPRDRASSSGTPSKGGDLALVANDDCVNADVIAGDPSKARVGDGTAAVELREIEEAVPRRETKVTGPARASW